MFSYLTPSVFRIQKVASPITKEFPKAVSTHIKGFLKAARLDYISHILLIKSPAASRNPLLWVLLGAFRNSFMAAPAAFKEISSN
jgi:hypothetical protein